jgi:EmrB/QacA subfamily drug resistance transporter
VETRARRRCSRPHRRIEVGPDYQRQGALLTATQIEGRAGSKSTLVLCALAMFMVVLDGSIVNVALPQMRHALQLTLTSQQWVVNSYTLTFAGFLMLGGRAADLFGKRRVFIIGVVVFTGASLLGGLAQDGPWLIAARATQGIGGAILAPTALTILTSTFVEVADRRRAMGVWSAVASCGSVAGVLAGGILIDLLNWRWVLFVNVPIGVGMLAMSRRALPEFKAEGPRSQLDLAGAFAITGGLTLFVYGIVNTDTHPWGSPDAVIPILGGVAILVVALFIEGRVASQPLVPLGIFRRRSLAAANGIGVTVGAGLFGVYFFISLYLQQVVGFSALRTGVAMVPSMTATLVGALVAPRLVALIGAKRQLIIGPTVAAAGLFWLSFLPFDASYWTHVLGPLVIFGVGVGVSFVPMTLTATNGVSPAERGLAAGLINTTRQMGGALGLAVFATIAASTSAHDRARGLGKGVAVTSGYDRAWLIAGLLLLVGAGLAFLVTGTAANLETTRVRSD